MLGSLSPSRSLHRHRPASRCRSAFTFAIRRARRVAYNQRADERAFSMRRYMILEASASPEGELRFILIGGSKTTWRTLAPLKSARSRERRKATRYSLARG